MIAYLTGKTIHKGLGYLIIEVSGIGYQVFTNNNLYKHAEIGKPISAYTHQYVREDTLNLYGFKTLEELELFELLLSISGIGPKSALGVLSIASAADIKESIFRGDSALLTKVSGIGRKTAERVILELREKVGKLNTSGAEFGKAIIGSSDEIDALMALGYSLSQARDVLNHVDPKIKDSGERIKAALKKLGK